MNEKIFPCTSLAFYETVYLYMKAGLLHGTRNCWCCGMPMHLGQYSWYSLPYRSFTHPSKPKYHQYNYRNLYWLCTCCYYKVPQFTVRNFPLYKINLSM